MYTMHINEYFWKYHTLKEQQLYQEEKDVDEFTLLNLAERFNYQSYKWEIILSIHEMHTLEYCLVHQLQSLVSEQFLAWHIQLHTSVHLSRYQVCHNLYSNKILVRHHHNISRNKQIKS